MRWGILILGFCLASVALAADPVAKQQQPNIKRIAIEGEYVHPPSGMKFPDLIAQFRRSDIAQYDKAGDDVSAGYNLREPFRDVVGTVYVYPAKVFGQVADPVEMQLALIKEVVIQQHKDGKLVSDGIARLQQGETVFTGKTARFTFTDKQFFGGEDRLCSDLYLFQHGEWLIKYRFTYPDSQRDGVQKDIANLMRDLKWPPRKK